MQRSPEATHRDSEDDRKRLRGYPEEVPKSPEAANKDSEIL